MRKKEKKMDLNTSLKMVFDMEADMANVDGAMESSYKTWEDLEKALSEARIILKASQEKL